MAQVTLYFEAFPNPDAVSLRIEETVDDGSGAPDAGSWAEIENVAAIGSYPDYVSNYTTALANSISDWFRIRWELSAGGFTPYSDAVLGSALPLHFSVPDVYRDATRLDVAGLTDGQIQLLIDRAYYLLQSECGPYNEDDAAFGVRAQMAVHLLVDRLLLLSDPQAQKVLSGYLEEQKGSYRYRRSEKALELLLATGEVPSEIRKLICPFALDAQGPTIMITTQVFDPVPNYLADEDDIRRYVFTDQDEFPQTIVTIPDVYGVVSGIDI